MLLYFVSKYKGLHELMRTEKCVQEDLNVQHEVITKDVECQFNYLIPSLGMSLIYCHVVILFY